MDLNKLQEDINQAWDGKLDVFSCKDQIEYLIELLDSGQIRAAEKTKDKISDLMFMYLLKS